MARLKLLAGGHPGTQMRSAALSGRARRGVRRGSAKGFPGAGIAEETGDGDEEFLEEDVDFVGVFLEIARRNRWVF